MEDLTRKDAALCDPLSADRDLLKEMFKETVSILALRIPQGLTGTMLKRLDGYVTPDKQSDFLNLVKGFCFRGEE